MSQADTPVDEAAAWAWLRRFSPCLVLADSDGTWWVSDRARSHRIPAPVASVLGPLGVPAAGTTELTWATPASRPTLAPTTSYSVDAMWASLPGCIELRVEGVHTPRGYTRLVTNELQPVDLDLADYEQALADGVTLWIGKGPDHLVFGAGANSEVLVVLQPL